MGTLLAADSWLVVDGRVRGWALHWARFGAAVAAYGVDAFGFAETVAAQTPRTGAWFPRVELDDDRRLHLRVRPAPAQETAIACLRSPALDDRATPRIKGPDLDRCAAHRVAAAEQGAGEVLLADPRDGTVREGAFTSLLWWEGDTLCAVSEQAPILAGVTRELVLDIARDAGVAVRFRAPLVEELLGCEVWLTSALHGIRAVNAWVPNGPPAVPASHAPEWRERLAALAAPPAYRARAPIGRESSEARKGTTSS